jgi:hypothetical protein
MGQGYSGEWCGPWASCLVLLLKSAETYLKAFWHRTKASLLKSWPWRVGWSKWEWNAYMYLVLEKYFYMGQRYSGERCGPWAFCLFVFVFVFFFLPVRVENIFMPPHFFFFFSQATPLNVFYSIRLSDKLMLQGFQLSRLMSAVC